MMTKIRKKILMVTALLAAGMMITIASAAESGARPNILWIIAEDFSPNLGCYGDPDAKTPNLDRLAEQGVRFTHAFSHGPVCAVARSTLITGMSPVSLGTQQMRTLIEKPASLRTFPEYLRDAGYFTFNGLKMGSEDHDYRGQSKDDFNFRTPAETWEKRWATLPELAETTKQRPFFGIFGSVTTHQSQYGRNPDPYYLDKTPLVKQEDVHDPAKIHLPPYFPDESEIRQVWAKYHDHAINLDRQVGELVRRLEQHELLDDTIIFFFGDHGHGVPGGKHWLWNSGLQVPLIVHVPEKFRSLFPKAPGSVDERLVSFEDFAPTVLELAGIEAPAYMAGSTFMGAGGEHRRKYAYGIRDRSNGLHDLCRSVTDDRYHYVRNYLCGEAARSLYIVRAWAPVLFEGWDRAAMEGTLENDRQRVFYAPSRVPEELYDNEKDPMQIDNLADSPKMKPVLEKLRAANEANIRRRRDIGFLPEYEVWRRAEAAGITQAEVAADSKLNPIDRLLSAAKLAGERNPANAGELTKLLADDDSGVRFWAAKGLGWLGGDAAAASPALEKLLADASPDTRLAAAEALCMMDRGEPALPVIREALEHDSIFVRMRACNVVLRIPEADARQTLPALQNAQLTGRLQIPTYHLDGILNLALTRLGARPLTGQMMNEANLERYPINLRPQPRLKRDAP